MLSLTAAELLHLKETLAQKRPGHGLPRDLYHDALVYRAEMDFIWRARLALCRPLLSDSPARRLLPV